MTRVYPARSTELRDPLSRHISSDEMRGDRPVRLRILVDGVVQGVGFRPFVHRAAVQLGLSGFVRNSSGGVEIEAEGQAGKLQRLLDLIGNQPPPISEVRGVEIGRLETADEPGFTILPSIRTDLEAAMISPDMATCEACLAEMNDPADRRYDYPFTNCTDCGPRFTIIEDIPYDRDNTTMKEFQLCPACAGEYKNIGNRRYHAEPVACPVCGPQPMVLDRAGNCTEAGTGAVQNARRRLRNGQILAVKGLGGFHLAADAACPGAVSRLRRWKRRPHRPLAVMCRDLGTVRAYCRTSAEEERVLSDARRPILLLQKRMPPADGWPVLASAVAPGSQEVGVMLPYTPLHHLLFDGEGPDCLVMTSGNRSDEPMVIDNGEAVRRLGEVADALLVHNRPIWNRCDDSVGYMTGGRLNLIRRSRGFVPLPLQVDREVEPSLALGAMLNNTFAVAAHDKVYLSQHIGDVDNLETLAFMRESINKFRDWLGVEPAIIAHDMHPDLLTTHLAKELAGGRRCIGVQHHHAHFAAALTAACLEGPVQGWVLDGTGWGTDRTIWGGELLVGSIGLVRRAAHLRQLPLAGGEAAIRRPLRLAAGYLHSMMPGASGARLPMWRRAGPGELEVVRRMVDRHFNTPLTSSAGRLFDAVAALLGVRDDVSYEGQAAIELEQCARAGNIDRSLWNRMNILSEGPRQILDPQPLFESIVDGLLDGCRAEDLALGFHHAFAQALAGVSANIRDAGGPSSVVLCGGVFQNRILTRMTVEALQSAGLDPVAPGRIPVNDGGLALGQVMVANAPRQEGA